MPDLAEVAATLPLGRVLVFDVERQTVYGVYDQWQEAQAACEDWGREQHMRVGETRSVTVFARNGKGEPFMDTRELTHFSRRDSRRLDLSQQIEGRAWRLGQRVERWPWLQGRIERLGYHLEQLALPKSERIKTHLAKYREQHGHDPLQGW